MKMEVYKAQIPASSSSQLLGKYSPDLYLKVLLQVICMKMEVYKAQIPASSSSSGSASASARDFHLPQIRTFSTEGAGVSPSPPTWVMTQKLLN